jgi:hypothetical protein
MNGITQIRLLVSAGCKASIPLLSRAVLHMTNYKRKGRREMERHPS